jgi:periplasmic mercuric ion binding protein
MKTEKFIIVLSICLSCSIMLMAQTSTTKQKEATHHQTQNDHPSTNTFKVYGNCKMCKKRIETAARGIKEVKSATWSVETKMLSLQYDDQEMAKDWKMIKNINMKIAEVGHDTQYLQADDKAYQSLPECCRYERLAKHQKNDKHNSGSYNH